MGQVFQVMLWRYCRCTCSPSPYTLALGSRMESCRYCWANWSGPMLVSNLEKGPWSKSSLCQQSLCFSACPLGEQLFQVLPPSSYMLPLKALFRVSPILWFSRSTALEIWGQLFNATPSIYFHQRPARHHSGCFVNSISAHIATVAVLIPRKRRLRRWGNLPRITQLSGKSRVTRLHRFHWHYYPYIFYSTISGLSLSCW